MKIILVDAVFSFIVEENGKFEIFQDIYDLLEAYSNKKIILTSAGDENREKYGLDNMPYEVFTLKHNPEKTDPKYYEIMLKHFNLDAKAVIYFEHNQDAVKSAESIGILTYYYDKNKRDLVGLKKFIDDNL